MLAISYRIFKRTEKIDVYIVSNQPSPLRNF
jgi:hypothetical protein